MKPHDETHAEFIRREAEGVARRDREMAEDDMRHEVMELEREMWWRRYRNAQD